MQAQFNCFDNHFIVNILDRGNSEVLYPEFAR